MNIDARDFFTGCRRLDRRIDGKLEEVQRLRSLAEKSTASYSGEPRGCFYPASKVENAAVRIMDMERDIDSDIDRLVDLRRFARKVIARLSDDRYRDIITWRYFNGWGWERISTAMNYDAKWAMKLHGRALDEAQEILDSIDIPDTIQNYYLSCEREAERA